MEENDKYIKPDIEELKMTAFVIVAGTSFGSGIDESSDPDDNEDDI